MNPTFQWALGAIGGVAVVLGGLMAWLLRVAYGIGASAKVIEELRGDLVDMKRHTDQVPVMKTELDTLADAMAEHRRKTDSDMKELRRAVWGRSSPGWANGQGGHDGEE